jgi:transcriptional regulator with XRE-family HTH domain
VVASPVTRSVFTQEYDRFRRLLVEARKTAGLTQAELAARLSRPQSFISKIEHGERRLDVIEFFEVAQALGIDPMQFLTQFYSGNSPRRRVGA